MCSANTPTPTTRYFTALTGWSIAESFMVAAFGEIEYPANCNAPTNHNLCRPAPTRNYSVPEFTKKLGVIALSLHSAVGGTRYVHVESFDRAA